VGGREETVRTHLVSRGRGRRRAFLLRTEEERRKNEASKVRGKQANRRKRRPPRHFILAGGLIMGKYASRAWKAKIMGIEKREGGSKDKQL